MNWKQLKAIFEDWKPSPHFWLFNVIVWGFASVGWMGLGVFWANTPMIVTAWIAGLTALGSAYMWVRS